MMLTPVQMQERVTMVSTMRWDLVAMLGYALDCKTICSRAAEMADSPAKKSLLADMACDLEAVSRTMSGIHDRFVASFAPVPAERRSR